MAVYRRTDVDSGHGKPQGHKQSAGKLAATDRPAIRGGLHMGAAIRLPRSERLWRKVCSGDFGGRTAGNTRWPWVLDVHKHNGARGGNDSAELLHQRARGCRGIVQLV